MKNSTFKTLGLGIASLILIIAFQNCSKTAFSPTGEGDASLKAADAGVQAEAPPAPQDDVVADDTTVDEEPSMEEEIEDAKKGVVCIGNGIKVPVTDVVNCADGNPKCVNLCSKATKVVATFKSARDLIKQGATSGACP